MMVDVRLQPTELWRIAAASRERRLKMSSRARVATSIARRAIGTDEVAAMVCRANFQSGCKAYQASLPRRRPISTLGTVG
jgi:hypothetical protein